ncbi:hypothetical protein MMC28_006253 [Mycoblastus sanguinarius]|nr:hypothetical protein [Mycoblastus sanguinarius]
MTERGDGWLIRPSSDPSVTIGLTLSTSASSLSLSSSEPFYIIVTARILSTPHPDKSITLQAHPSPLDALSNRSFHNITCTTKPAKQIEIIAGGWPQYRWDSEDLRSGWPFVSIPPRDQGSYSVRHELPRNKIEVADLQKGERYKVALTDKCLGTLWWAFASLEELESVRLRAWRGQAEGAAEIELERADPELHEEMERERSEKYGDGPAMTIGENPMMLAMVRENKEVVFEASI